MWEAIDRKWWVTGWRAIESRFFRFTQNDQPLIETLRAPTGEPIPDGALLHVVQDHAGRVVRGGAFRAVLKPWLYKSYALVDAISFLERFGHPHVQVQLGPEIKEGSPELERAKAAARSFIADQVGLCPPGVTLQILDAVNKAANVDGVYLSVVKWCDAAISKSLLGQTETTEGGDSGGYARAKVHMQVEQSLRELRGQRLDETLTDQLLRPWTLYHYGATAPVPRVHHCVETPEDEKARAETEEIRARTIKAAAHDIGVAIPTRQVRDELRLKEPTKGEDVVGGVVTDTTRSNTARRGHAEGVCPNCAATIDLALAEKKKRAASWAT
jgi:phage gp29-like protein